MVTQIFLKKKGEYLRLYIAFFLIKVVLDIALNSLYFEKHLKKIRFGHKT